MSDGPPKRHIEFGLRIGADSVTDVVAALMELARDARLHGEIHCVSGGCGSGYECRMASRTNEGITHEDYFQRLDEWIEADREREADSQ